MSDRSKALAGAAFIAWTDYGYEGWSPTPFKDEASLVAWVNGGSSGGAFVITSGMMAISLASPRTPSTEGDGR